MVKQRVIEEMVKALTVYGSGLPFEPTLLGLAGAAAVGGAVTGVLDTLIESRRRAAADLLMEQLAAADITEFDAAAQSEFASMLFGFQRCATEGVAKLNLRLMAQIMRRQLEGGRLRADEFKRHADVLASLKRDEIIVLATVTRVERELRDGGVELWSGQVPAQKIWELVDKELISPELFKSEEELRGVAWGLFRTGMLMLGKSLDENMEPKPSPLLKEIALLCDLEKEGVELKKRSRA